MSRHAKNTPRARSWGHPVLGLFVVVWLNLALQPCAVAMQVSDDCLHCPPAQEHAMAAHHGHGEMRQEAPCASLDSQCGDLDEISFDGRSGQLKVKDTVELPAAITHESEAPTNSIARHGGYPTGPPIHAGVSPPRYVLFCVYLK